MACPAQAADDYFSLSLAQLLDARVYSASKKQEAVSKTPAAVYVVTQEDIQRSGVTSIPDALRLVPGVNVAKSDSNTWAISIRGFQNNTANKLLVMIDGRTVYNPFFAGTFWEVQDLPLEDILRIEVIRGPGGTLWGANAVNGVINILTKSAKDTQGALLSGGGGNYEKAFGTARMGGQINDDTYFRVYGRHTKRDSSPEIDGRVEAHDEWDSYHTGFRVDKGDEKTVDRIGVHGDLYRAYSDAVTPTFSFTAPFQTNADETIHSGGQNLMGFWRHAYESGARLRLQAYLDYTHRDQVLYQDQRTMFDTDAQYNFAPMGRHEIIAGGSYRYTSDDIGGSDLVNFEPGSRTDDLYGVFLQDKITLRPDLWFLTLGSKFEHNDYSGFEVEPNARLTWTPDEQQTFWGAISRAVRMPSRAETDLNITNLRGIFGGALAEVELQKNKNFKSEELVAYELGYRNQITPEVSLDTTAFFNDYTNLSTSLILPITVVNNGVDPIHLHIPVQAVNGASAEVLGFEMAGSWSVQPNWRLMAGYSYLEMYIHAPTALGASQDSAEGTSPEQQINLRSYWNINDRWTLDTMLYYVDAIPSHDIDPYLKADVNLGWQVRQKLRLNLVGQDLFDDAHREFGTDANAAQVGRSVFAKITWEF